MEPKNDLVIRNLALYAPKIAYGLVVGVPRVPVVLTVPLQFSSSAVNAPPIVQSFQNNLTQDTLIERVSFSLFQQNSFPGSPFQSLYFSQLKQQTGIGITCDVFGGPKYAVTDSFVELADFVDIFATTWPGGWPLFKQSNVKISAILLQTPTSVPYSASITFCGWQALDAGLEGMSNGECRARLRKLGIESPDLEILLKP